MLVQLKPTQPSPTTQAIDPQPLALVSVNGGVPGIPGVYIALRLSDSDPISAWIGQDLRLHESFQPNVCLFRSPREAIGTLHSYARSRKLSLHILQPFVHTRMELESGTDYGGKED